VKDGRVTDEIVYLSALEEEEHTIAQANAPLDAKGHFTADLIPPRTGASSPWCGASRWSHGRVAEQLVSVAASLIPFLENDDAKTAPSWASNMQRQAVPLLRTDAPLVARGWSACGPATRAVTVVARVDGVVEQVDSMRSWSRRTKTSTDGRDPASTSTTSSNISAPTPETPASTATDRDGW